jgi:hypothetical protein
MWQVPEKILLPAEPDGGTFKYNGRLPNGDQVMAYVGSCALETHPPTKPYVWFTAVLFRFDEDGVLRSCEFTTTSSGGDYVEQDTKQSHRQARELLDQMVQPVKAEGWVSADIIVRPFYVVVDRFATGLIYRTEGEDEGEEPEDSPEEVRLVPFDKIFRPPWKDGLYST